MAYQPGLQTFISTLNSTTSLLTAGSVFSGSSEDVSPYSEIRISVISDVTSSIDGLSLQQSSDAINWDNTDVYSIPANTGKTFGIGVGSIYFRVIYTNGTTNQSSFRLLTTYHLRATKASSVRPQNNRSNDNDMEEMLSYNMSYDPTSNVWNRSVPYQIISGVTNQTATVNNIIPSASSAIGSLVGGFGFGSIQVSSSGTGGTFIFECSNSDTVAYQTMNVWNNNILTGTPVTTAITATASTIIYYFPITTNYIRVRIASTITGGSIQALTSLKQFCPYPVTFQIAQATAANLNATVTGTITANLGTGGTGATSLGKAEDAAHASGDTGVPIWGVRNDAVTSSASANGDYSIIRVDQYGQLITIPGVASSSNLNNITASLTNATLIAANNIRKGLLFYNESTGVLFLKYGSSATTSSYSVQIVANGYYELPVTPIYTGIMDGFWTSTSGSARITELI